MSPSEAASGVPTLAQHPVRQAYDKLRVARVEPTLVASRMLVFRNAISGTLVWFQKSLHSPGIPLKSSDMELVQ